MTDHTIQRCNFHVSKLWTASFPRPRTAVRSALNTSEIVFPRCESCNPWIFQPYFKYKEREREKAAGPAESAVAVEESSVFPGGHSSLGFHPDRLRITVTTKIFSMLGSRPTQPPWRPRLAFRPGGHAARSGLVSLSRCADHRSSAHNL